MAHTGSSPQPDNAASATAALLARRGVRRAFVYAAAAMVPLLRAIRAQGEIELIHLRSEAAVAFAAAGYARASGELGVCIIGGGPAATSMITGIFDAQQDSVPLLVLSGQVAISRIGTDAWQETDTIGMTASVSKHNFQPRSGGELLAMVEASLHLAQSGRAGAVIIDIPEDILAGDVAGEAIPPLMRGYRAPTLPAEAELRRFFRALSDAKKPLILLGGGTIPRDAAARIVDLAEALNLPVATTMTAKGAISELHPHAVGMLGTIGRRSAIWAYQECDLLIAFGCRFAERMTGEARSFQGDRAVIHIDIDAVELGKNTELSLALHGECLDIAEALLRLVPDDGGFERFQPWLNQCATAAAYCHRCVPHPDTDGLHPKRVMDMINQRRRSDQVVVTGVGAHQSFAAHFLNHQRPRTFISSSGAGARAFGLPAAIGACIAAPNTRVLLIDGDIGFQASIPELANVDSLGLPLLMFVLDNGSQAREMQDDSIPTPYFVAIAEAYGIEGYRVHNARALEDLLDEVWNEPRPVLIHVDVAPVPMLPRAGKGEALSAYTGNCVAAPGQLFSREEARVLNQAASGSFEDAP